MSPPTPEPFKINITEESLSNLNKRLELTRPLNELEDEGWNYGSPLTDIRGLVKYWKDGFDWRKQEDHINSPFSQFTLDIDVNGHRSLNVHFLHHRSEALDAIPLLFIHGWSGNFLETAKLVPHLTDPEGPVQPSFHVIVMILPGFTFSEAPKKRGSALAQYAEVGHKLMLALGYDEYDVQGDDWGSVIATTISAEYVGECCKAIDANMIITDAPKLSSNPLLWLHNAVTPYTTPEKRAGISQSSWLSK